MHGMRKEASGGTIRFCTSMTSAIPTIVMKSRGWKETRSDDWDIYWSPFRKRIVERVNLVRMFIL